MDLEAQLTADMKAAMKSGEKEKLQTIRMVLSDVKNRDLMPGKPSPESLVEAYAKKLKKSAEEYQKIGKTETVDALKREIAIVEAYLPKKLDESATRELVDAFLASGQYNAKQTGQATGLFMKQHGSQVDPGVASKLIRDKLSAMAG
jgi:uncharacterized protein